MLLVLGLLTLPWWRRVLAGLWIELWSASEPTGDELAAQALEPGAGGSSGQPHGPLPSPLPLLTSSGRVRAFRRQPVRAGARAPWQGGFGRRGL